MTDQEIAELRARLTAAEPTTELTRRLAAAARAADTEQRHAA